MKMLKINPTAFVICVFSVFISFSSNATHIAGGDITYKSLNDTDYIITLTIYRDCEGVGIGNGSREIRLFHSTGCSTNPNSTFGTFYGHPFSTYLLPLTNIGGTEVSQLCDAAADSSFCSTNFFKQKYTGMQKFVYEDTIVVPFKCNSWYIAHYFNARNSAMNAKGPQIFGNAYQDTSRMTINNGRPFYIDIKINNDYTFASGNSGPVFTSDPIPYFCKNIQSSFNYSVVDVDGDILKYELVPGQYITNINDTSNTSFSQLSLVYRQPEYTSTVPLHDAVLNPSTGNLSFKQRIRGRYVVVMKVTEYDRNHPDSIKSELVRDVQFFIDPCSGNNPPELVSGGIYDIVGGAKVDSLTVKVLKNMNLCFSTSFTDLNLGDTLTTTNNRQIVLSGSTETISGVNPDTTRVCWTPPSTAVPNYSLSFTSKDNHCPVKAATSVSVNIEVVGPVSNLNIIATKETCFGASDGKWTATFDEGIGPFRYYWIKNGIDTIFNNSNEIINISSNDQYSVVVTDSNNMTTFQSLGQNLQATLPIKISNRTTKNIDCNGGCVGEISILAVTGGNTSSPGLGGYKFSWSDNTTTATTRTQLCSGRYTVTVEDDNGCDTIEQFSISQKPVIEVNIIDSSLISCGGGLDGEVTSSAKTVECGLYSSLNPKCSPSTTDSATIGTGTIVNSFTGFPTPFSATTSAKQQYLYLASELRAMGFTKGRITKVSFFLQGSFVSSFSDYSFAIACTDSNNLDSGFVNAGFDVYGSANHTFSPKELISLEPQIVFDNEFEWDGKSNILIQVCNSKSAAFNSQVMSSTTSFNSAAYFTSNTTNACLITAASNIIKTRPNIKLFYCDAGISYSWNTTPVQIDSAITGVPSGTYIVTASNLAGCDSKDTVTLTEPPNSVDAVSNVINNPICSGDNNGSVSISVSGGIFPYTFAWPAGVTTQVGSDSIAISLSGNIKYKVTVTDSKGCEDTITVLLTDPDEITFSLSTQTDVLCKGFSTGSINVNPVGGSGTYTTYAWTPAQVATNNISNLSAGNYTVTVTDNLGCNNDTTFTITEPANAITFGASTQLDVACKGASTGSVNVVPMGGSGTYMTYVWTPTQVGTNNITNLSAGSYTVTVTDNAGCAEDTTFTINEPLNGVTFGSSFQINVLCKTQNTGQVVVVPQGGLAPYTNYRWTGNVSNNDTAKSLLAGSYTVTVSDALGCDYDTTFIITEPTQLVALVQTRTNTVCGSKNGVLGIQISGGTQILPPPPYIISWDSNGTMIGSTATINNLYSGLYNYRVEDANGCVIQDTASIDDIGAPILAETGGVGNGTVNATCDSVCDGAINLTLVSSSGAVNYTWSNGLNTKDINALCAGTYSLVASDQTGCSSSYSYSIQNNTNITSFTNVTNLTCNTTLCDAKLKAGGQLGVQPYSYQWNTSVNDTLDSLENLCAGTFSLTITDSRGCKVVSSSTINPAVNATLTLSMDSVSCNGGSDGVARVNSVNGGTAPFTYQWSTGPNDTLSVLTGLSAGKYYVTVVEAGGCLITDSIDVLEPDTLINTFTIVNADCGLSNGSVTENTSNGRAPYTYTWPVGGVKTSNNDTGYSSGIYNVIITDVKGCSASKSFIIGNKNAPVITIDSVRQEFCFNSCDGAIFTTVSGGNPIYLFDWSPGMGSKDDTLNLCAGTYTLKVTDQSNCVTFKNVTVNPAQQLIPQASVTTHVTVSGLCTGSATASPIGGSGSYVYQWAPSGSTSQTANGLCAGTHYLTVTDNNTGCIGLDTITVTQPAVLILDSVNIIDPTCATTPCDGSVFIKITGGTPPYNYLWDNGDVTQTTSGRCAGVINVTVTDRSDTSTFTFVLKNPTGPTFSKSKKNVQCYGESSGEGYVQLVSGGPVTWSWPTLGINTDTAKGLSAGIYEVRATDGSGCITADTISVLQPDSININLSSVLPNCGTNSGQLSVKISGGSPMYNIEWLESNQTSFSPAQTKDTLANLAAGIYYLSATDNNNCTINRQIDLKDINAPTITLQSVKHETCLNNCDGEINVNVFGGAGGNSYQWTPTLKTTEDISNLCAGSYTLEVTDMVGCKSYFKQTIASGNSLTTSTSKLSDASSATVCDGSASVTVTGGLAPISYVWTNAETNSLAVALCGGKNYVTITDATGCTSIDSIDIESMDNIFLRKVEQVKPKCGSCDGQLKITPDGGQAPYTFLWDNGDTADSTINRCAGVVFVTVTDKNGLSKVFSQGIDNTIRPNISLSKVDNTCFGKCEGKITAFVSGTLGPYSYNWPTLGKRTAQADKLCAGVYLVEVTDRLGCIGTNQLDIIDPPKIQVTVTTQNPSCNIANGSAISIPTGGTANTSGYTFSWLNGLYDPIIPFQNTNQLNNAISGKYFIEVRDAVGCKDTTLITLEDNGATTNILLDSINSVTCASECDGGIFIDTTTNSGGTFEWIPSGETTKNITGICTGTYTVIFTESNKCKTLRTFEVLAPDPLKAVFAKVTDVSCEQTNDGSVTAFVNSTESYKVSWSGPESFSSNKLKIENLLTGVYTISVTDDNNCTTSDSIAVDTINSFSVKAGDDKNLCQNITSIELGAVVKSNAKYSSYWYNDRGEVIARTDTVLIKPTYGQNQYRIEVRQDICTKVDTININVADSIFADAGLDRTIFSGQSVEIGGNPAAPEGEKVVWSPDLDLTSSNVNNPVTSTEKTITYFLTVGDFESCSVTDSVTISVSERINVVEINDGFSPNGDGVNDVWEISVLDDYPNAKVTVFNRWGQTLYVADPYVPWDGTYKGNPVAMGTYYYIISLLGDSDITGPVTIIR